MKKILVTQAIAIAVSIVVVVVGFTLGWSHVDFAIPASIIAFVVALVVGSMAIKLEAKYTLLVTLSLLCTGAVILAVFLHGPRLLKTRAFSTPTMDQASNTLGSPTSTVKDSGPTKIGISGKIVVTYTTFDERPVELVYEPAHDAGRVTLRIKGRDYGDAVGNDDLLLFLKQAVVGLTGSEFPKLMPSRPSVGKTTKLGETGYYFVYGGGYPIWGPHGSISPDGDFACLSFAENATFDGKIIKASGRPDIIGYNGYTDYVGRQ